MWSVAHLCRCPLSLRAGQLLGSGARNGFTNTAARQLLTPARSSANLGYKTRVFRISELLKSNGIVARFCTSGPKPKPSKAVGYWLLGCSGMVFTAVVLGMVSGYLVLLYCVYYVVNLVVNSTNGSK